MKEVLYMMFKAKKYWLLEWKIYKIDALQKLYHLIYFICIRLKLSGDRSKSVGR